MHYAYVLRTHSALLLQYCNACCSGSVWVCEEASSRAASSVRHVSHKNARSKQQSPATRPTVAQLQQECAGKGRCGSSGAQQLRRQQPQRQQRQRQQQQSYWSPPSLSMMSLTGARRPTLLICCPMRHQNCLHHPASKATAH